MAQTLSKSSLKIEAFLNKNDINTTIKTYPEGTRTAQDAANAIGCDVAQIVKSLIFMTKESQQPILILTSGINRVDESLFKDELGEKLTKADAAFVREYTGYAIGGVPPFAHDNEVKTFIDESLFSHETVWGAAGTANTVFSISMNDLDRLTNAKRMAVSK